MRRLETVSDFWEDGMPAVRRRTPSHNKLGLRDSEDEKPVMPSLVEHVPDPVLTRKSQAAKRKMEARDAGQSDGGTEVDGD
jgi:hypothetical protein